jgi:hypothetical protein
MCRPMIPNPTHTPPPAFQCGRSNSWPPLYCLPRPGYLLTSRSQRWGADWGPRVATAFHRVVRSRSMSASCRARCRKRGGSNPSCRLPRCVLPSIGVRGRALALPTLTNPMPPHQRRLGHHKVSPRARRLLDGANGGDYVIYRTLTTEMILLRISHRILLPRYEKNPWSPTTVASMSVTRSHMGKDQSSVAAALSCCQTSKYRIGRLYGVKIVVMTSWYGHLSMCELVHSEYSSLFTSVIWSVYCQANDEFLFYSCTLQWISGWGSCPDSVSYE